MSLTSHPPSPEEQIAQLKASAPARLYLIPTHDDDRGGGWLTQVWCDDPAPTPDSEPTDAVGYVRADVVDQEHAELRRLLQDLALCEQRYRVAHDHHAPGDLEAGRAWIQLLHAGRRARRHLAIND